MTGKKAVKSKENKFYEELAEEVKKDFLNRQNERRSLELQWELNINYLMGNQYCEISPSGEVEEEEKYYFWQNRNVYNHIAPIMDTRIAKLNRIRPIMSVRASGDEESDIKTAKITTAILNSTYNRLDLNSVIYNATVLSEVFGTSFYKIMWDGEAGKIMGETDGEKVYEGDAEVIAVSPFEIFPDSLFNENISDCKSLIHARAMHVKDVEEKYGVLLKGGDVNVFNLSNITGGFNLNVNAKPVSGVLHDHVLVIERYERPCEEFPNGRIITVADNKILYIGGLPYENGVEGRRDFPFVKQTSINQAGAFFGVSMIERIIPLQRAYNAVKNRKQEYLNRLSMGVLTVEDGSTDTDDLTEEGLSPGKVIVYRQGSRPPQIMATGSVPADFTYEEERLTSEFILISGVSEFSRTSAVSSSVSSGTALQLLIEQDDTRMSATSENVRRAIRQVAKHIIRLFKQFALDTRIMRIAGENKKVELYYFNSSDISSDDVVFDTENELSYTPAQKKNAVFELLNTGLLTDKDGKIPERTKVKILEILGFGTIDNSRDLDALHMGKAEAENLRFMKGEVSADEYDDHNLHIAEHTRFILSSESENLRKDPKKKQYVINHIREHKKFLALSAEADAETEK